MIIATAGVYVIALGLTYPLLALILEKQGASATLIGANTAMTPLGIIVSSPLIPWLARKLGPARLAALCAFLGALLLVIIGAYQDVRFWFPARFVLGMALNGSYVISETWVIQLASTRNRGRVMGFYATILSAGFAVGPFVLALTGTDSWAPFGVVILITAGTGAVLYGIGHYMPGFEKGERSSIRGFILSAPFLLAAVSILAFFDQAVISLLPVYGLLQGLTGAAASSAVGVLVLGSTAMQLPIGWLADRLPRRRVMALCALLTVLGSLLLPLAISSSLLRWPLLFFWGGFAFGGYTAALAELGDRFSGGALLAGNACFGMAWGIGGIVGAPLSGLAMDLFGPRGLPVCLGAAFAFLAAAAWLRKPRSGNQA